MYTVKLKIKAQSSLEVAVAFVSIILILYGTLNVFIWLGQRFVLQQEAYEAGRVAAGTAGIKKVTKVYDGGEFIGYSVEHDYQNGDIIVDDLEGLSLPKLDILGTGEPTG